MNDDAQDETSYINTYTARGHKASWPQELIDAACTVLPQPTEASVCGRDGHDWKRIGNGLGGSVVSGCARCAKRGVVVLLTEAPSRGPR